MLSRKTVEALFRSVLQTGKEESVQIAVDHIMDSLSEPPKQGETPRTGDWWCPECKEALPGSRVTFTERCDTCGTPVHVAGEGEVARLERELAQMAEAKERAEVLEYAAKRAIRDLFHAADEVRDKEMRDLFRERARSFEAAVGNTSDYHRKFMQRAESAERRVSELEATLREVNESDYKKIMELKAALAEKSRDAERYQALKWQQIFHYDADDAGSAAEEVDAAADKVVEQFRVLRTDNALAAEQEIG